MGIYDRDYYRREPRRTGGLAGGVRTMSMWSTNTWIIVICVAVFVVDGFLGAHPVAMNTTLRKGMEKVDRSALIEGQITRRPDGLPVQPLYVQVGSERVLAGWREMAYMHPLQALLHFSTKRGFLQVQFWRLVGFQFLHHSLAHLFFNMLGLYFFGSLVEQFLGSKRYLAFYLLCGIFGALMYTLLNLGGLVAKLWLGVDAQIPGLLFNDVYTPLIGASAGVFGVLMAGAYLAPNTTVLVFFIIPMRLRTLAYALVVVALVTVLTGGNNAGGQAGHIGGALAGFYFIRHPHHLHGFVDFLGWIDPTSHHYQHGPAAPGGLARRRSGGPNPREVDRVLDKVHARGLASLTDAEKRILREASDRR